jgi:hypothetical protein
MTDQEYYRDLYKKGRMILSALRGSPPSNRRISRSRAGKHHRARVSDLAEFRSAVERYVGLLIRARWRDDPGFLDDQMLSDWDLLDIQDDRIPLNRAPSWALGTLAADARADLILEFFPHSESDGIANMEEGTPEGRLMYEVTYLTSGWGTNPYHNRVFFMGREGSREAQENGWDWLVNWSRLPFIRADLDQLPLPKKEGPERPGPEAPRPSTQETPLRQFPKMDGLRWEEVTIAFVSSDSVRITARGRSQIFMFSDICFRDGRKGNMSDEQWLLLQYMSAYNGEMRWDDAIPRSIKVTAKAKIKIIRKRLCAVVQINEDPFEPYWKNKSYKTKFNLIHESCFQLPDDEHSTNGN